jgi:soluble lytic murein transglycosylase-like protein
VTIFRASVILYVLLVVPSTTFAFCFEEAGKQYGVSPAVLWAIADVESKFDPTAINPNEDGTYDFGLMQVNSWWSNILGPDVWALLSEPCYNVKVGAWLLSQCIQEHGHKWEAIGCYHSRRDKAKKRYAWMVYNSLIKHIPRYRSIHYVR